MGNFTALFILGLLLSGCSSRSSKFEPVVADIQKGVITLTTNGAIALPPRFANLAPRGEIYAEKKSDGRLLVLFPTWYGRGNDIEGLLYCSASLLPTDFYTVDWGPGGKQQHMDVAGRDLLRVAEYKAHWYNVTRRLD
jgi:hypothetical protein